MLHKSGVNLESSAINFLNENDTVTLFSAYLKLDELKKINAKKKIKRIVVRWEIQDLCLGVSDPELFHYCKENKITLYRNTRIHLKAFWNNDESVLFGSANVTNKGLGEKNNYNFELNGLQNNCSFEDLLYLNKILSSSEYVTDSLFNVIMKKVNSVELPTIKYPHLDSVKSEEDFFLMSQLPMTDSIERIYNCYSGHIKSIEAEIKFIAHDLALYNIEGGLTKTEFYSTLTENFNNHPFILKLKEKIINTNRQSLNYGGVVKWIQENTTTVPIPRSWEIKKHTIVNILYSWICELDQHFSWSIPGAKSQVIFYNCKLNTINN
ncbi:MAG: hypothetical protein ACTH3E_10705 [Psychroflexus halocasei]